MSYILDALKKSEQERGQGNIPNVQTVHSSSLNYSTKKNTYWPYILIAAVLLNLLAISYFIFDKEKNVVPTKPAPSVENTSETNNAQPPTINEAKKIESSTQTTINNSKTTLPEKAVSPIKSTKTNTTSANTKKTNSIKKQSFETNNQFAIDYNDLSHEMKNKLPNITVSAHVYSTNPLQRSIVINNNFMEEGEYISNELLLREITPDGAVFDFEGDLINYSVISKWQ